MSSSRINLTSTNTSKIPKDWRRFYTGKIDIQSIKTKFISSSKLESKNNQNTMQLFSFIKKLPNPVAQKLYKSLPGGEDTAKSILRFILSVELNKLTKAFPENVYKSAQNILTKEERTKWIETEKKWLANNPLTVKDTSNNIWKMYHLPWWQHNALSTMRLFYQAKIKHNAKSKNKSNVGNRFVLELSFTNIGALQIDGLVKDEEAKIWLLIKSEQTLESDFQNEIKILFTKSLASSNWQAIINFQAVTGYMPPISGISGETNKLI